MLKAEEIIILEYRLTMGAFCRCTELVYSMLYHSCILTDSVKLQQESSANICETSLGICKKSNRKFVNDTKI